MPTDEKRTSKKSPKEKAVEKIDDLIKKCQTKGEKEGIIHALTGLKGQIERFPVDNSTPEDLVREAIPNHCINLLKNIEVVINTNERYKNKNYNARDYLRTSSFETVEDQVLAKGITDIGELIEAPLSTEKQKNLQTFEEQIPQRFRLKRNTQILLAGAAIATVIGLTHGAAVPITIGIMHMTGASIAFGIAGNCLASVYLTARMNKLQSEILHNNYIKAQQAIEKQEKTLNTSPDQELSDKLKAAKELLSVIHHIKNAKEDAVATLTLSKGAEAIEAYVNSLGGAADAQKKAMEKVENFVTRLESSKEFKAFKDPVTLISNTMRDFPRVLNDSGETVGQAFSTDKGKAFVAAEVVFIGVVSMASFCSSGMAVLPFLLSNLFTASLAPVQDKIVDGCEKKPSGNECQATTSLSRLAKNIVPSAPPPILMSRAASLMSRAASTESYSAVVADISCTQSNDKRTGSVKDTEQENEQLGLKEDI